ncbi:MAG: hypothetical protein ABIF18_03800 [archaeon]
MMVKLYDKNFTREDVKNLQQGDVIIYPSENGSRDNYLIVNYTDGEAIFGQIATIISVNSVSVENIVDG